MTKSLIIVSSDQGNTGAISLNDAAQKIGLSSRQAIIGKDDVVSLVNNSDYVIFRISPKTYDFYEGIKNNIDTRFSKKLEGALAAFDKAATYDILTNSSIPTPKGYRISKGEAIHSFPAVIKVLHGNQGNGVALLKGQTDYDAFVAEYDEPIYFVQDFIEQATGRDKRLVIAGGELMGAMERRSTSDDFRANLHQGGVAVAYTPTDQEIDLAKHAAYAFGLDFAGIDIIDSNDGPLVLEVNPSPGLQIGEVIGIDIAEKIIKELFHD